MGCVCSQCNIEKELSEFYVVKKKTGEKLSKKCKTCIKNNSKDYYNKHKDTITTRIKKYKKEQKDNNTAVYLKGLETNRIRQEKYQKTNNGKMVNKSAMHNRRIAYKDGSVTTETLKQLLIKQDNKCYICKNELDHITPRQVHLDHIVPLSKGGSHVLSNVAWACACCNLKKSNNFVNQKSWSWPA